METLTELKITILVTPENADHFQNIFADKKFTIEGFEIEHFNRSPVESVEWTKLNLISENKRL